MREKPFAARRLSAKKTISAGTGTGNVNAACNWVGGSGEARP